MMIDTNRARAAPFGLTITNAAKGIHGGMSGSPICGALPGNPTNAGL
jgi:hypothetical protein